MSTTLKWGLITGAAYIIYYLLTFMLGLQMNVMSNIGLMILFVLAITIATYFTIHLGIKEHRDTELNGFIPFKIAFKTGLAIAVIGSVGAALISVIYTNVIDPDYNEKMMEAMQAQMQEMGVEMTDEQIQEQNDSIMRNPVIGAAMTLLWHSFMGVIKSLIAGSILKKDSPPTIPSV